MICKYDALQLKLEPLREHIRGVATGKLPGGLYLHGPRGHGKSELVEQTLLAGNYEYGRITGGQLAPGGLFEFYRNHNNETCVFDDAINSIKRDTVAKSLFLASLGNYAPGKPYRWIEWLTKAKAERVKFYGSSICLSNEPLGKDPISLAIADRMLVKKFGLTEDELETIIYYSASKGMAATHALHAMTADDAMDVATKSLAKIKEVGVSLSLRHFFEKARSAWSQVLAGETKCTNWLDIFESMIREETLHVPEHPVSKDRMTKSEKQALIGRILRQYPAPEDWRKCVEIWHAETASSKDSWYRERKKFLKANPDFHSHSQSQPAGPDAETANENESPDGTSLDAQTLRHVGGSLERSLESELERLARQMAAAIACEDYERAAKIRDEIRRLESEL